MNLSKWCIVLFFILPVALSAQERGDYDYVFESLAEANKYPDQVYQLSLSKNKLEVFPENLERFVNLRYLDLSRNKLSMLPAEIGELATLKKLDLSKNKIYTIPPQIGKLKFLEELILSKNDIEKIPAAIGNLSQLKKLDLWENNIQEVDPAIAELTQLEVLDLRGMIISEEMQKQIAAWLSQTTIHFSASCNCF